MCLKCYEKYEQSRSILFSAPGDASFTCAKSYLLFLVSTASTRNVVLFYSFHGDRGHTTGEHVDRDDGKHLPENRRDPKRVAETSK